MSTILIVDDEKNLRRLLRDTLEGEGHTTLQAGAGEEASERFQEASCDLVLLERRRPATISASPSTSDSKKETTSPRSDHFQRPVNRFDPLTKS